MAVKVRLPPAGLRVVLLGVKTIVCATAWIASSTKAVSEARSDLRGMVERRGETGIKITFRHDEPRPGEDFGVADD